MAKKRSSKPLKTEIKEVAAAVEASQACAACGKPMAADLTTCPNCGTPVGEAAELTEMAEESLMELEKHLAETALVSMPNAPDAERPSNAGLESAAEVEAAVEAPTPARAPAPIPMVADVPEATVESPQELEVEEEELGGFIEDIEEEVGPGEPEPQRSTATREAPASRKPMVRAVHKPATASRSSRWVAPVAAGLVIYVLALFLLALLGRVVVASSLIVATVLVFAGLRARPSPPGAAGPVGSSRLMEYVCPLCGTEIAPRSSQCPTCGAVFED